MVAILFSLHFFISIMVESNSSCLETYKITVQSCLYLVWLRRYDKKLIWVAILDFFSKCSRVRTPHPLDVIIYMLEMNNQQRKKLYQAKRGYPSAAGLGLGLPSPKSLYLRIEHEPLTKPQCHDTTLAASLLPFSIAHMHPPDGATTQQH